MLNLWAKDAETKVRIEGPKRGVFAGIFVPECASVREVKDGEATVELFAFLKREPKQEVAVVHPKAMPIVLTVEEEWKQWLRQGWDAAKVLQQPLPDGLLYLVNGSSSRR